MLRNENQRILWELCQKIIKFLEDNDLKYYIFAGTAIGALRHEGFIPWDDDIDLMMDRENYERLVQMSDQLPWDDIELVSTESSDEYFRPFAQFSCKTDTSFLQSGMFNMGECMGTLIDVFVLDEIPLERLDEYEKDLLLYQETLVDAFTYKNEIGKYADEWLALREECQKVGRKKVIERLRDKLVSYSKDDCDTYVVRFFFNRQLNYFHKSGLEQERLVLFEDKMLPVPTNQEAFLRVHYGYDWYMVPNVQGQEIHGFYVNRNVSNNNYFEDISNFVDWDEAQHNLSMRKAASLERLKYKRQVDEYAHKLNAQKILMRSRLSDRYDEIIAMDQAQNYAGVAEAMSMILSGIKSFSPENVGDKGIRSDVLDKWIFALIVTGKYYVAHKVLSRLMPDWETIECDDSIRTLQIVTRMAEAYQDNDNTKLAEIVKDLDEDVWYLVPDYIVALARLANNGMVEVSQGHIREICDKYLAVYQDNWDVLKTKADTETDSRQALDMYRRVYENTRNGMLLLELQQKCNFEDWFDKDGEKNE